MKKTNKKGFTIVELVIVIAVVAILAAVLIPTFVSITKKANESKDTQLVRNLNTALAVDTEVGKHETMQSALEAAAKAGYDVAKINTSATDNEILWDSKNDCFAYLKDNKVEYIPNSVADSEKGSGKDLWRIVRSAEKISEEYSNYIASDSITGKITTSTGFDAGNNKGITEVEYNRSAATAGQSVVIRTNGSALSVNALKDTVYHHGAASSVTITAVAGESYHEHGEVNYVKVENGRFVAEAGAKVITVYAATNDAKIDNNSGTIKNAYKAKGVTNSGNAELEALPAGKTESDLNKGGEYFAGGIGTESNPYLIATGKQAYDMREAYGYFKVIADVTVTNEIYLSAKTVVLDLNGHSITLEYADDVKPNNGGVLNIAGKGGNLTINDSSEAKTGSVIGSDKSYVNKVTCAVRVGNYGTLTINGGNFYGKSEGTSCIFVMTARSSGSKATVVINGGYFETATPSNGTYFVLNHQDSATAGCTITVNGGTFKNYEPGVTAVDPVNAYTGKIGLGAGCSVKKNIYIDNFICTVVKG